LCIIKYTDANKLLFFVFHLLKGCLNHYFLKDVKKCFTYFPIFIFQNTFVLGGFIAYKFRHVMEMFTKEDYKKNQFLPNLDYIPGNEASIIRSLKSLYDLDPRLMLFKVTMINVQHLFTLIYNLSL